MEKENQSDVLKMRLGVLLTGTLIVLAVFGCNMNEGLTPSDENMFNWPAENSLILNDTLEIGYQDTLFNSDDSIWIAFDSLVSDSRCPIGAVCKWEGNAELSFMFYWDNETNRFSLNTHSTFTNDTTLWGYQISMINVFPYPHTVSLYTVEDYSVEIVITRLYIYVIEMESGEFAQVRKVTVLR